MIDELKFSIYVMGFIFLGTTLGGWITKYISSNLKVNNLYINVFCGGLLIGLIGFDLLPETLQYLNPIGVYAGISLGVIFMEIIDRLVHKTKHRYKEEIESFILLFIALFIHSIPTGVALGMNLQKPILNHSFLIAAIVLHHIPEGVIMMASILHSKMKLKIFWFFCFILSFAVGLNTFWGIELKIQSVKFYTLLSGAAIGTLSYVSFYEILWKHSLALPLIKVVMTTLLGVILMKMFTIFMPMIH
ncbi:Zinc uptake transporter [Bacillus methanolicus PB1]|uniref:Zinc uptake transporter n=1 Tax=Bacillus methanolicus PB1 TaxID=997296 RepID=I3DVW8_BACMT|nr:ZIP family metal transporter [Bacillus methanolicus]EIJ78389.1 Zinc uptake transporter [Bacillus methanolicus PB1]